MAQVRFGIVGVNGMGGGHAAAIAASKSKDYKLAAVADIVPEIAQRVGEKYNVPFFNSGPEMFESGLVDAVIVATPHYWHPVLTIQAARKKLHVLCEKPLAVTVGAARAMIAECKKNKVALGTMLQQRTRGEMIKMKQMIDRGEIGEIFRVSMVCSSWYRTQTYYNSGSWRGTWDGEGGGILLNQAPHSLDLFQWIGGMPKKITAVLDTRLHKIEVENSANAICEYGPGKVGYIYATTAEAPGMEQFMVCGDKGTLIAENGKLRFGKLKEPISKHLLTCKEVWAGIPTEWVDVPWTPSATNGHHINVINAFAAHVLRGKPLVVAGSEAINELEISNAIYISGFKGKPATLPVDAKEIDGLIGKLARERSSGKGGNLRGKSAAAMKKLVN